MNVPHISVVIDGEPIENPVFGFSNFRVEPDRQSLRTTLKVVDPASKKTPVELPLTHSFTLPFWKVDTSRQVEVVLDPAPNEPNTSGRLEKFLESHPPRIVLDSGASIQQDILSTPKIQNQRFDPNELDDKDWKDTDLKREARKPRKKYRFNVMGKATEIILSEYRLLASDLLICDDRAQEVADLLLIQAGVKSVTFFHLKYKVSSGEKPGTAREDVDELVGQGVRTGHWIRAPRLMARLKDRVEHGSKVMRGNPAQLANLVNNFHPDEWTYRVVVVQPGLSREQLIHATNPTQAEQLLLMLRDRITGDYGASLSVWTNK